MENAILIFVLAAILGGAVAYIVGAKRNGVKCIGCSAGGSCGQKMGGCSACSCGCERDVESKQSSCEAEGNTK